MPNDTQRSLNIALTHNDVRYMLHALNELMTKLEAEIKKDPDGIEEKTPMYADDVFSLRDIYHRLRQQAIPVFGEKGLEVSYETL